MCLFRRRGVTISIARMRPRPCGVTISLARHRRPTHIIFAEITRQSLGGSAEDEGRRDNNLGLGQHFKSPMFVSPRWWGDGAPTILRRESPTNADRSGNLIHRSNDVGTAIPS